MYHLRQKKTKILSKQGGMFSPMLQKRLHIFQKTNRDPYSKKYPPLKCHNTEGVVEKKLPAFKDIGTNLLASLLMMSYSESMLDPFFICQPVNQNKCILLDSFCFSNLFIPFAGIYMFQEMTGKKTASHVC